MCMKSCEHAVKGKEKLCRQCLGAYGEDLAACALEKMGYTVLDRRWRKRYGEIDLVVRKGEVLVAVEVKARAGAGYGVPFEAVTFQKIRKIRAVFEAWLLAHPHQQYRCLRIDVVGVTVAENASPKVQFLRHAQV